MAYRPQYRNKSGIMVDLPLDAETVRGKEVYSKEETDTRIAEKLDEKQTTECNCSHEVEITGFGEEDCNLAIDDQDVVITKIQGQTRRKSLNLLNIADVNETTTNGITYSIKDGVINLNGTATTTLFIDLCVMSFNGTYYAKDCFYNYGGKTCNIKLDTSEVQLSANKSFDITSTNERVLLRIENGMILSNVVLKPMIVSGNTPPTYFEPYDNTLVNSKCDFVSTGRNLLPPSCFYPNNNIQSNGSLGVFEGYSSYYKVPVKPNTNYTISYVGDMIYNLGVATYDVNGNFISYETWSNSKGATANNAYFISFDFHNTYTNIMLNYGTTALPYEPYVEDKMQCGIELGQWDYHDNINHITHRQTSPIIDLSSLSWTNYQTNRYYASLPSQYKHVENVNVAPNIVCNTYTPKGSNLAGDIGTIWEGTSDNSNIYIASESTPTGLLVYETIEETTETNILPSGYKVWYKGMQVQKTETLPYILTKQYAISLPSQVLNNVSVDRSQQKQIDDLKENKLNSTTSEGYNIESFLKLLGDNVKKTINTTVSATTGSKGFIVEGGTVYNGSDKISILPNSTNKTISNLKIENGTGTVNSSVSYNSSTGVISFTLQGTTASTEIFATVSYDITINQYLENQTSILSEESLEEQIANIE